MKSKIYTKSGDDGTTRLGNGERVAKNSKWINACGAVDELSSFLGLAKAYLKNNSLEQKINRIQQELIRVGGEIALTPGVEILTMAEVKQLEKDIDVMSQQLPPIRSFIVPDGSKESALLHVARTVCRRAEREVAQLTRDYKLIYLNRLSDWLFVAAQTV